MSLKMKPSSRIFENSENLVIAGFSDRRTTVSTRSEFVARLSLNPEKLYLVKQVHGENIIRVDANTEPTNTIMADGLLTKKKGVSLGVLTADCVPVFFWDPVKQVIGIVHAGWRGALHGIAPKMVSAFQQNFGSLPENIRVGIGPCIRQAAYEVGQDFQAMFPGFYQPSQNPEKGFLDLSGFIQKGLTDTGIFQQNIEDCGLCTFQEQDHFYSYRREKQTSERMLSVISMQGENDESE